jgi:carboxypeptidase Q
VLKPILVLTLFSLIACAASAQSSGSPQLVTTHPQSPAASEELDRDMYSRIREEGFKHSRVMEYAGVLMDDIGPRLTGSPAMKRANDWTRAQLVSMGCSNAHLEGWGEFGMAWTQLGATVDLVKPTTGILVAQATPWSPSTHGLIVANVVAIPILRSEADFSVWKGKLKAKVILYGEASAPSDDDLSKSPELRHDDAAALATYAQYPLDGDMSAQNVLPDNQTPFFRQFFKKAAFQEKVAQFFSQEGAIAVLAPGGSGGVLHADTSASMGWLVYRSDRKQAIPEVVVSNEGWSRIRRLLEHKVPVELRIGIAAEFGDEHVQGFNTIAEIPGQDPALKEEVVMVGGHLDSWNAGTGATDNGAGAIVAMEAMRILNDLHVQPRRTIRIALWTGEEQGILGSTAYVTDHFAKFHYSDDSEDSDLPPFLKRAVAPPTWKPEASRLDAYFNLDNGTGKLLGIYTEGNEGVAAIFSQWIKPIEDLGMTTISERNSGSTDHVPFQQAGLPGFQFIQDPRDYERRTHHTNLDTYERLSEPDLKQAAVIEAIFLYNTAMRDEMLPRPRLAFSWSDAPLKDLYPDAVR